MNRAKRSRVRSLGLLTVVVLARTASAQQPAQLPDSAISEAERAMHGWFGLLAQGQYDASWNQAGSYFRAHVSREQWQVNASDLARQFRRAAARTLVEARWLRDEPPLPPAEYVVLRWLTVIDENRQVGERVIVAHEADGSWRPATYDLFPNVEGIADAIGGRRAPRTEPVRPQAIAAPRKP